jgi:hypothetical protein
MTEFVSLSRCKGGAKIIILKRFSSLPLVENDEYLYLCVPIVQEMDERATERCLSGRKEQFAKLSYW